MADLAPSWRTETPNFSDTKGRKVVVQHKVLRGLPFQVIDKLFIALGPKRRHDQSLRFPTGKEG
jgi:hypothetical protein